MKKNKASHKSLKQRADNLQLLITQKVFSEWTVIGDQIDEKRRIECRCSCGKVALIQEQAIRTGKSRSCGCKFKQHVEASLQTKGMSLTDRARGLKEFGLIKQQTALNKLQEEFKQGQKFNRLTSTGRDPVLIKELYNIEMICECGNVKYYNVYKVRSGHTKSCGCHKIDVSRSRMINDNIALSDDSRQKRRDKGQQTAAKVKETQIKNGTWSSPETVRKRKATNLKRHGNENAMAVPKIRAKAIETLQKNYGVDNPTKNLDILKKANKTVSHTYVIQLPNQKEIFCKGTWELGVAMYLLENNIQFEKEPRSFELPSGRMYTPDFYLLDLDLWIEVKGGWRDDAKTKWDWFHATYPNSELWNKEILLEKGIIGKNNKPKFDIEPYRFKKNDVLLT